MSRGVAEIRNNLARYSESEKHTPTRSTIKKIETLLTTLIEYVKTNPRDFMEWSSTIVEDMKKVFMSSDLERTYASHGKCEVVSMYHNRLRYKEPTQNHLYLVFLVNVAIRIRDTRDPALLHAIAQMLMLLEENALTGILYIPNVDAVKDTLDCGGKYISALRKSPYVFYYNTVMDVYNQHLSPTVQARHRIHDTYACTTVVKDGKFIHGCILPSIPISNTLLVSVAKTNATNSPSFKHSK